MQINITVLLVALFFFACEKKCHVGEYLELVNNNESYQKEQGEDKYIFKCRYRPGVYMAAVEVMNSSNSRSQKEKFEIEKHNFENTMYFNFSIGLKDSSNILPPKSNILGRNRIETYLSSQMDRSFFLLTSGADTVKCLLYQYLKSNDYSPNVSFLISFPKSELAGKTRYVDFVYLDHTLGRLFLKNIQ